MDFERASIKALFYDYPIEAVIKVIEDAQRHKDGYLDILPQLVRWREDAFTTTEARLMENLAQDIWMNGRNETATKSDIDELETTSIPFIYRPFWLVRYMANKLLAQDSKSLQPIAVFNGLLRWKDITLFLGEDLFTTAYLADKDLVTKNKKQAKVFAWHDYISHDNLELNDILDKGLTDVHAHYNASCDVFALNWISLTNSLNNLEKKIEKIGQYQDVTLSTSQTEQLYTLKSVCIAASYLRLQFYKLLNGLYDSHIEIIEKIKNAKQILEDEMFANQTKRECNAEISVLRAYALRSKNGRTIDYAITPSSEVNAHIKDANLIFHGERKLMYQFFYRFYGYDSQMWDLAPYFYLYIVLKTRIRKEFVQINQLKGFENFETYQERKDIFIGGGDPLEQVFDSIVLHTTLRNNQFDFIEGRVTPTLLCKYFTTGKLSAKHFSSGTFTKRKVLDTPTNHISFVVHFIKANYSRSQKAYDLRLSNRQDYPRYYEYRNKLKNDIHDVLKIYEKQQKRFNDIQIVGIDAASTEMFCRPEVFGHIFRYARKKGLSNQTYHVGEDFFDIIDGLRAIDEAILFLGLDSHCRIGHGLAMGIDAQSYYERRHYRIIAPRQCVLDNCVWLCMTASREDVELPNSLETELNRLARELYKEIGYSTYKIFDMQTYWNSMLLRGDEPYNFAMKSYNPLLAMSITDWQQTEEVDNEIVNIARKDKEAKELYKLYHFCRLIKVNGEIRYQGTYPKTVVKVVTELQKMMRRRINFKQIAVEVNPSSNLKIGYLERYCEHPLLTRFDPPREQHNIHYPLLNVSVNTDDRGVFATTLYNEFSLVALSMMKQKDDEENQLYGTRQIMEYIAHLRQANEMQRFKGNV